ncbi:MAG: GTPase HflX [Raoultibacter sp.]
MSHTKHFETDQPRERAILVGIDRGNTVWPLAESLAELERLADTAGAQVVGSTTQKLNSPNPRTFIGSGKAEEVAGLCRSLAADIVIFDDELTPSQQANLEKIVSGDVKVIDRTALILDIFGLHATSKEGRLQVRLAQNQYLLPRLRGMWAHLASNRMGGGVGSRFGEGESQLEVDRRMVRKRITAIKRELADLNENRQLQRKTRAESGIFRVALVGYTNAGKSSLLNALTDAKVLSYDKLFATLDSTTRRFVLPEGREITLTDTVGFIQKLPTTLIEAFKSTLDEILGANLILHVIDASSQDYAAQITAVNEVLDQIGAHKIGSMSVFNKIDVLTADQREALGARYKDALFVSALEKQGLDELLAHVAWSAASQDVLLEVLIPYDRGDTVSLAHERCRIVTTEHTEEGTRLTMQVPAAFADAFKAFVLHAPKQSDHLAGNGAIGGIDGIHR